MQALVHKEHEPITPFVDRVRDLYEQRGVSTVLVMGGCGDYFDVADTVIMMQDYQPVDVTERAERVAREFQTQRTIERTASLPDVEPRIPLRDSLDPSRGRREVKIDAKSVDAIAFGHEVIDVSGGRTAGRRQSNPCRGFCPSSGFTSFSWTGNWA